MAEANVTTTKPLPPEVLVKVFEHCDLNELVHIVDVCQLWRDVAIHQHASANDLVVRRPDDISNLVSLLCKPVSFTKLHVVWDVPRFVRCSSVSLDALTNVTSLTHLQSFTFKVKAGDNNEYRKVLEALLTLLLQTSTDTLTHFTLNDYKLYNQRSYVDIIPTLTHLQSLDLRGTHVSNNLSFIAAIKRGCPNISNNIMIERLRVRPSDDVSVLEFVSYVDCLDIDELGTEQLRSLVNCLNARVTRMTVVMLDVTGCKYHLTDDILLSLVQPLHLLKEVRARDCHNLTNEGVVNVITSYSPPLENIVVCGIQSIGTDIIQLLNRVVTEKDVYIVAWDTKLSDQMWNNPDRALYTGRNSNIRLEYR